MLPSECDVNVPMGAIDSDMEIIEAEFLGLYVPNKPKGRGVAEDVQGLLCTGRAADDVEDIRASLAVFLDAELLQESDQKYSFVYLRLSVTSDYSVRRSSRVQKTLSSSTLCK